MAALMAKLNDGTHRAVLVAKGSRAHMGEEMAMAKQTKTQKQNAAVAKNLKAKKTAKTGKAPKVTMTKEQAVGAAMQAVDQDKKKRSSGLDAAAQVLRESGKPMGAKAMVETMLAKGLWKTDGKTPEATIYAAIIREIAAKKEASRFVKTGRGEFAFNTK
jgi:hypothetical protein